MSFLDWIVLGSFLALTVLVGLLLRSRNASADEYFLGSRQVGVPLALLSLIATETSAVSFLSVPAESLRGDLRFLQLPLGYIVGRLGVAFWIVPLLFAGEHVTLYQVIRSRCGVVTQRATSGLFIATRSVADGLRLFLTALLVQKMLGVSLDVAILVTGAVTVLYATIGGIRSVLWTDAIQLVVYLAGAVLAILIMSADSPGGLAGILTAAASAGKLRLLDFRFDLTETYTFWSGVVGGAFLSAATHGADQMMVQRYLCTGSARKARWVVSLSGICVFAQFGLFLLVGLGLWHHLGRRVPDGARGEDLLIAFILEEMPIGIKGVIVASILAAAMSTLSSSINSIASAVVGDFLCRRDSHAAPPSSSRLASVAAGAVQVGVALAAVHLLSSSAPLIRPILSVAALTTGVVLGLLILARTRTVDDKGAVSALVLGSGFVFLLWLSTPLAFPWFTAIGMLATWGAGLATALLTGTSDNGRATQADE